MKTASLAIRLATPADLPAINDIYNHYVPRSTCTYQHEPETAEARAAWFAQHGAAHPVIVGVRCGEIVGWGSLSPFRTREAYRHTVENSVYVRHDCQRQGIGSLLLADLIVRAKAAGHHVIIAAIDSAQAGSIALHLRHGFVHAGRLHEVGFKFGQWLDGVHLELVLGRPNRVAAVPGKPQKRSYWTVSDALMGTSHKTAVACLGLGFCTDATGTSFRTNSTSELSAAAAIACQTRAFRGHDISAINRIASLKFAFMLMAWKYFNENTPHDRIHRLAEAGLRYGRL
jgi:phosphinothricin acetyltransferase